MTLTTHDRLNRLVTQAPGGVLRFSGTVSEPASVTVQGQPASVTAAGQFVAGVPVTGGTNTVTIAATDPSGNTATAVFEVDQLGAAKSFTHDANGNLTSDGTRTFEWDARNQIVAVTVGTHRSEFSYDGLQRRVRQVEKDNGVTTADTRVLWCETAICEERSADGVTVTRRALGLGEQIAGQARFFATDHLGSVREVTDATVTLLARYAFDPWGRRTVVSGADITTVGFTGHRVHTSSALALTLYRGYDVGVGRWVSEDPIGVAEGPNRLLYVANRPIAWDDPLGLAGCCAALKQRREQLQRFVNEIERGRIPIGGAAGSTTCYFYTYQIDSDWIEKSTNACWRSCVYVHERIHAGQCERLGSDRLKDFTYRQLELPAFRAELQCVTQKLRSENCSGCKTP